ncbi:zinc-ribbon and DUF3426 domain-containing protein [Curvibacter sp. APW13]|uniref:zinc-ribbon and DUF3426 domain-containing protein n=1 Tax=Curvibacter sp. APW13 TaxID=3077236 RepID=UPI0028DE9AFF|nr:zinc-ribbon and DUF3426 domain-containing protein [Curvibacter sp. APW13]MDT8989773.1 zinc-ribbon and DUF3426 domain-containing protein [Curvibacter sp. APW13]
MPSLVTRCPACTTLFKVVPDQLRISEGWVRCGQCDEVFDANANMQPSPLTAEARQPGIDEQPVELGGAAEEHPIPDPAVSVALAIAEDERQAAEGSAATPIPEPSAAPMVADHGNQHSGAEDDPVVAAWGEVPSTPVETPSPHSAPSFLHRSEPKDARARFLGPWRLLGGVMALLLAGQWLFHERDQLATMQPALRPVLEQACDWLGCRVQPLRRIDSLVIESSSFVKVKSDVYRLSFVVRNTASWPLAIPSAELALTDLHDHAVMRRVLQPSEFVASASTLSAGGELSVVVPIAVKAPADLSDKISGYRLLVFYP